VDLRPRVKMSSAYHREYASGHFDPASSTTGFSLVPDNEGGFGMSSSIEVLNKQRAIRVSPKKIKALIRLVLKAEQARQKDGACPPLVRRGQARRHEVSVLVTDDRRMRYYNRRYLGHPGTTDVIAFNPPKKRAAEEERHLGDIVISAQQALRQAPRYHQTPLRELERYVVHGVLHLLGYRDKRSVDVRRMRSRENLYLEKWEKKRHV